MFYEMLAGGRVKTSPRIQSIFGCSTENAGIKWFVNAWCNIVRVIRQRKSIPVWLTGWNN